ncbi:MAG TPA: chitobiase/beta-hexosaminidase C-terminal domain-containing protein [Candidatus Hydrogenedentes bacterium]|nr:chitobiase/beta-hexosaminidase C-terminal domain-containing protein [Candidatus Hydrogenedentota bacterium]
MHYAQTTRVVLGLLASAGFCCINMGEADAAVFIANERGHVSMAQGMNGTALASLTAETRLDGCETIGEAQTTEQDGRIECRKRLEHEDGHGCVLVERFTLTEDGLHWEIAVEGEGAPWTTGIRTCLKWAATEGLTWWAAWGDSRPDAPENATSWTDPLVPTPFEDACFCYGARRFFQPQAISLPLVTVLDAAIDRGISLLLSPEDIVFDMKLRVTTAGEMEFSRTQHRIAAERPICFAMDLTVHEADWRAALGSFVKRYPQYFDPVNPKAHAIAGCGAYSSHSTDFDAERLMRMAFRINWKASFDFPYMGMFIPPVPDDETEWTDFKGNATSIRRMREDIHALTAQGFYVLNYFNVTEFGAAIQYPPPPRKAQNDEDLWHNANDFLYYRLGAAILPKDPSGAPIPSWEGCVAMDPGDPVYREHLIAQARRHIEAFPESSGICIDRMDWLQYFNPNADDGLSWVDGKPTRSLVVSWHEIMSQLGPIMHGNDKVIFGNPHYRRLDLLQHVDGVYDEFGQMGHSMNLCALLCLRKPVLEWTIDTPAINDAPDSYFQRHLHMGAFPTAPLAGNDHTILPTANIDQVYFDYGPLLDALRGKRWVLEPHAVEVAGNGAKANLFEVPGGYVAPVTFAGDATEAHVVLRHLTRLPGQRAFHGELVHPGETEWAPLTVEDDGAQVALNVPLERGCAMVKLSTSWIAPATPYFTTVATIDLATTIENATIRYTLDGGEPTAASAAYTTPVTIADRTLVRMATFVDGVQLGEPIAREYVKVAPTRP